MRSALRAGARHASSTHPAPWAVSASVVAPDASAAHRLADAASAAATDGARVSRGQPRGNGSCLLPSLPVRFSSRTVGRAGDANGLVHAERAPRVRAEDV